MNIRSITGFADLSFPIQPEPVLALSRAIQAVRDVLEQAGYTVQTTRLATQPAGQIVSDVEELKQFARQFEEVCATQGIAFCAIGPFLPGEADFLAACKAILESTNSVFLSSMLTTPDRRIDFGMVNQTAKAIQSLADVTPDGLTNLRLAASANLSPWGPFFPTGYHGGGPSRIAIATESADLVVEAASGGGSLEAIQTSLRSRVEAEGKKVEGLVRTALKAHNAEYEGIDFSFAPFPDDLRSIGGGLEGMGLPYLGAHGSLMMATLVTSVLDEVSFKKTGFCGLMLPVLEDSMLAQRASEKAYTINDLLTYSAVCGTGLDTVPIPGDVSVETLSGILVDVAALALRLDKPLTARLMPLPGKKAGDMTAFDFEYFTNGRVLELRDSLEVNRHSDGLSPVIKPR